MSSKPATDFRIQHLREKLGGLYDFEALLGRGAFAAVYLVRNLRLDRLEALKVLSDAYDHDEAFVRRFIQEAKLVASLDHPNIVKVYDYGEVDGIVWFSMQFVDGPTLRAEFSTQGRLAPIAVARLAIPLLEALDHSHQVGTVHRDIKPSNILLDKRGHPYIMDFGIAKSSANVLKTMTGSIMGTPAYISPEQIQEDAVVDGRADLYALATAMYEMLAGQIPFAAKDPLKILVRRMSEDPEPLRTHCPKISGALAGIVMRGLAREPEDRFPDAGTMRQALVEYLREQSDQQELVVMASAPEPMAIEELPSTVPDQPALQVDIEAATVKMTRLEPGGDSPAPAPIPEKQRGLAWVAALVAVLALAVGMIVLPRMQRQDTSPAPVTSASTLSTAEPGEPPAEETQALDDDAQETSLAVEALEADQPESEPPSPVTEPAEQPAATAVSAETEAESASAPPPTVARAEPAVSRQPPAPAPAPIRRPVTVPKILSSTEPVLQPGQTAECAGQSVIISLRVGEDGKVQRSRVLKAGPETCSKARAFGGGSLHL